MVKKQIEAETAKVRKNFTEELLHPTAQLPDLRDGRRGIHSASHRGAGGFIEGVVAAFGPLSRLCRGAHTCRPSQTRDRVAQSNRAHARALPHGAARRERSRARA